MTDPSTDDGVLVVASGDVATLTGPDGVFLSVSPACRRLFGWEPTQLEGKAEADFVHPDDRSALRVGRSALVDDDAQTTTYRFLCSDGSYRWTETVSRRAGSDGSGLVVSAIRDISRRRAHTADLERLAFTDPLTGVANRPVLMDRLHQGLRRLRRSGGVLAVLYLDMDRFKVVNDSLGHLVGDAVLAQMAERLAHHLRPVDTLARLGGDEFAIVAEGLADEVWCSPAEPDTYSCCAFGDTGLLELARRNISEGAVEPLVIVPDDPLEYRLPGLGDGGHAKVLSGGH
jgi:PAS domain S-box-containing protein